MDLPPVGEGSPFFESSRRGKSFSPEIPCDLSVLKDVPKLLLIGEEHCSENSLRVRREAMRLGSEGDFFMSSEVGYDLVFYPWSVARNLRAYGLPATPWNAAPKTAWSSRSGTAI